MMSAGWDSNIEAERQKHFMKDRESSGSILQENSLSFCVNLNNSFLNDLYF